MFSSVNKNKEKSTRHLDLTSQFPQSELPKQFQPDTIDSHAVMSSSTCDGDFLPMKEIMCNVFS